MEVYEISGFRTGKDDAGVNFLDPADAFEVLEDGYIYRQVLQSRLGISQFGNRLTSAAPFVDNSRVIGIFNDIFPTNHGISKRLLVFTQHYMYSYSAGAFTRIPGGGVGTQPPANIDFGITSQSAYISGVSYLTGAGARRFVFCCDSFGVGAQGIYFYNGTDIRYFNVADANNNINYAPPGGGTFTAAKQVFSFNGRINFLVPTINAIVHYQKVLYSGIQDASGKGDKFNVTGSGEIGSAMPDHLRGGTILGDKLILNYQQSTHVLDRTGDANNPYFIRKVPGVLGTDAGFSPVSWGMTAKSIGKNGMIETDNRQSLRFDDKVPRFTEEDISQANFEMIYGGYDRDIGQFVFTYPSAGSSFAATTQDKVLVHNYEERTWAINNQRLTVFGETEEGVDIAMNQINETQNSSWLRMNTTEELWGTIGLGNHVYKTLAGDNYGYVYQLNQDCDDYYSTITGITNAAQAVVTCGAAAFIVGDTVTIEDVTTMTRINGEAQVVAVNAALNQITINIDSSDVTQFIPYAAGGGGISMPITFEAKLAPFNPFREQGRQCYLSHIEFLVSTSSPEIAAVVRINEKYSFLKSTILTVTPTAISTRPREWLSMSVNQEANFFTLELVTSGGSRQAKIFAIRLHCKPGSFTTP